MFVLYATLCLLWGIVDSASYQRYDQYSSTQYPGYPAYSTLSNPFQNSYQYKSNNYGSNIANFPEATRYPNYNTGYSTSGYNSYTTMKSNMFYPPGYSTEGYGGINPGFSSYEAPFMNNIRDYCINRSPQTGIEVDSLMGMWYGVEIIEHLAGDARLERYRSCVVIHISEPMDRPSTENQLFHVQHINAKFRQQYRSLRILWDEAGRTIEYSLYFRNDSAGYWQVLGEQNGTLASLSSYQQFSGSVQVLKAVHDHLVLNFCQQPANGRPAQLFSALFAREPGRLSRWEINSVHHLLQNKKLSVASRRVVCGSADKPLFSIALTIIMVFFAQIFRSR